MNVECRVDGHGAEQGAGETEGKEKREGEEIIASTSLDFCSRST